MVHSGSRNLGYKVAKHYDKIAKTLNRKWYTKVPIEHKLAFLQIDSKEGRKYLKEMQYCVDFAYSSRLQMIEAMKTAVCSASGNVEFGEVINIAHNYAVMEHHFGVNVMVHRKGATSARVGEIGIIPGSQGSPSYIVEGLGNQESFNSCSHGAGRTMGRKQAIKKLDFKKETDKLEAMGIIHSIRTKDNLDEATGAYKDIETVMANQEDLVKVLVKLTPLAVVKG
jgi:tRNA-splicing ligase RtcB